MPKLVYTLLLFLLCSVNSFSFKDFRQITSSVVDFIPILGNVKSAVELISGQDIIAGDKLSPAERGFSVLGKFLEVVI